MQITIIRHESEDVTTNLKETKRTIEYYEQLYTTKLDKLDEMDKFLETHKFPKLIHEEIENLNRSRTSRD